MNDWPHTGAMARALPHGNVAQSLHRPGLLANCIESANAADQAEFDGKDGMAAQRASCGAIAYNTLLL
jgi:hypothetical protein